MERHPKYWSMEPTEGAISAISLALETKPPSFNVELNYSKELHEFIVNNASPIGQSRMRIPPELWRPNFVTLSISDASIAFDYIAQSGQFFSSKAREVFDLGSEYAQFLSIDYSNCVPEVKALDLMLINPIKYEHIIDIDKSELITTMFDDLGNPCRERIISVRRVVFKEDIIPRFPVVMDPNDQRIYVSSEVAQRIVVSGITGIEFVDVSSKNRLVLARDL